MIYVAYYILIGLVLAIPTKLSLAKHGRPYGVKDLMLSTFGWPLIYFVFLKFAIPYYSKVAWLKWQIWTVTSEFAAQRNEALYLTQCMERNMRDMQKSQAKLKELEAFTALLKLKAQQIKKLD